MLLTPKGKTNPYKVQGHLRVIVKNKLQTKAPYTLSRDACVNDHVN